VIKYSGFACRNRGNEKLHKDHFNCSKRKSFKGAIEGLGNKFIDYLADTSNIRKNPDGVRLFDTVVKIRLV
jgi:hypothetical protein